MGDMKINHLKNHQMSNLICFLYHNQTMDLNPNAQFFQQKVKNKVFTEKKNLKLDWEYICKLKITYKVY